MDRTRLLNTTPRGRIEEVEVNILTTLMLTLDASKWSGFELSMNMKMSGSSWLC
jgi:hypothetical protein